MRRKATWLVLTAVGAVVIAGAVDAVRRSSSGAESAGGNVFTIDGLTMTAPSAQVTTEGAATTVGVTTTTEAVDTTAQVVESAPPERLPPCTQRQLKLAIRVGEDRAEFVLRRVMGQPCHLRRSRVRLRVLDQAGSEVVLSTSNFYWQRGTPPADFDHGFVLVTLDPYLAICDPRGTFTAVANVGPYVARRTVAGSEIDCRGS